MASKFDRFLLENSKIDEGPPVRYHLYARKENINAKHLTRLTVGQKNLKKTNKTILLLGETGSGKSTLVNMMCNHVMGVKFDDKIWFEVADDGNTGTTTVSQTTGVKVYELFSLEGGAFPYSLTIIDTPGYGDTKGVKHDAIISESLNDLFRAEAGVHEVDAVGLVLKASDNRLSDRLRYIFDSMLSVFGDDMEKRIVALITHSDGMPPINALKALQDAKIKCAKTVEGQPVHFVFNNCQITQITEKTEFGIENAWRLTTQGLEEFFAFLGQTTPQTLNKTVEVLKERISLTACINVLLDRIDLYKLQKREIEQTQEGLKRHERELETTDKIEVEVEEIYKEIEDVDGGMWLFWYGGAVRCTVCEENCHYPGCTLAWYPAHCNVMKNGFCTVCEKRCSASKHVKESKKYITKTRKVKKTIEVKRNDEGEIENFQKLLSDLEEQKIKQEEDINKFTDKVYMCIEQLENTALNKISMVTLVHLDLLIELMQDKGDQDRVQKLKDIKASVDEGTQAALHYQLGGHASKK